MVDRSQQEADALLAELDLNLSVSYEFQESEDVEEGYVISTDPVAGTTLNYGDSVKVVVSQGVGTVTTTVPNVVGLEEADAVALLEQYNLVAKVTEVENDEDEGIVFYQSISTGTEVPEGTTVSIKVSLGQPEPSPSPSPSEEPTEEPTVEPEPSYTPPSPSPSPSAEPSPEVSEEPETSPETSPAVSGTEPVTPDE